MGETFDFWKFLAGIGIFLWGMHQLEHALREIAGKSFKNLLQRFTNKPWKGILIGTMSTAILQSSTLVTLMVLAFLGGGMISLGSSLGVVLGANLGTTVTAWIVATLGFKFSVADFSFPFLAIGTLTYIFVNSRPLLRNIGGFLVGFGLIFLGLDFMKTAIEAVAEQLDFSELTAFGTVFFLLVGLIITALIQSSSAMTVIVLSALNAQVINLELAFAMMIGANIGTTFTLTLSAIGGSADKKRLALFNFGFNFITGFIVFLFSKQIIFLVREYFMLMDPLMDLVLLNTLLNAVGIMLFYPFLNVLEKWLRTRYGRDEPVGESVYVKKVGTEIPSVAVLALEKELILVFKKTVVFINKLLVTSPAGDKNLSVWKKLIYQPQDLLADYAKLKLLEDELTSFGIFLQEKNLTPEDAEKLTYLMHSLREMIYGAKDFKDIIHNIKEMKESEELLVLNMLDQLRSQAADFLFFLDNTVSSDSTLFGSVDRPRSFAGNYEEMILSLYQNLKFQKTDVPISTLTNVIKQVVAGLKHLGEAVTYLKIKSVNAVDEKTPTG
ncbi:Na/Pi cotransporter family protein [Lunatibacter salilacus]|uniref:Na/Pi cotransporter family protein n=1 Tax=Lunatibacter salilacus TaxID=2483804 RepID=UPI00131C7D51|nr:Na/Pi symporter [Lunatibacter salilacus]